MGKTVIAAMSGGVDSSVAAALLLDMGYDVIGITLNVWPNEETGGARTCCSVTDVDDARAVCQKLKIPHYVLNMRDLFREKVIDYFVSEYLRGRTPNPCVACNAFVKFEALLRRADELGADCIATGHYARISSGADGEYRLTRSEDTRKDQTYVLYMLTQSKLSRVLMPCGGYTKPEIRRIAEQRGLPTFSKPDSQDICFIGSGGYGSFIRAHCGGLSAPGDIVDSSGRVLGRHDGVFNYTVGQHKGLGSLSQDKLYVTSVDAQRALVTVGPESELMSSSMTVENISSMASCFPLSGARLGVKIRYSAPEVPAQVTVLDGSRLRVDFERPVRAVTPGQAAVFYKGSRVLGGGTILAAGPAVKQAPGAADTKGTKEQ
jgi:tRNA-specific 2-thiouridylase